MKKTRTGFGFSLSGFFLFFFTIGITSTLAIFVYYWVGKATNGNLTATIFAVLGAIAFGAILCTFFDIIRRKVMVEKPVIKILDATKKIASGDFNVKLVSTHDYKKYNEYDLIFDNINIMTEELKKNKLLKADFVSNVSHEIKTPLSVIQNYAKVLQNEKLSQEKRTESLEGLVVQTQKLSNLITNILKLNKLENQKIAPEKVSFDLAELVRVSTLQFESLFEKKQLQLVCDIDEMTIKNSANLLELVLNNLISNAIKFTNKGGKICISLKEEDNFAIIKVSDTGCGISKETGEHIFDKFYQGDTSHSAEGNGLGLALVKKVIDIIGGEIGVESKVGEGSTFTIKLRKE